MAAASKQTSESFLGLVKQCGLVEGELLKKNWKEMKEQGLGLDNPRQIADEFVKRNLLTRWQADKLLQGKHKGFFLGKYRLLSLLGSGGMSAVYLAEHILMRRRVAIKVLPKARVDDSSYLERFHREAQAVAALDHRNIVRAYDVDQEKDIHFLVMEYVPGQSLHELVAKIGPVDFVPAAEYMRQAAEGLQHAHRIGMVHRDIKPGNLLLDEKGIVKLLDLGLARFFDDKDENSLTVKHDEKVLGTADFLSPEQALNSHTVDGRSDIYSLGCTLYYLLTGHPPFPEGTLAQRLLAHQTKMPRPVQEERPDIPPGLRAILERMLAKNPDERFQTARDASQELLQWLSESGGEAWARMNPPVGGSSQNYTEKSGQVSASTGKSAPGIQKPGSTANVLTRDLARGSSKTKATIGADNDSRAADDVPGAATSGSATSGDGTSSGSDDLSRNPFADHATAAGSSNSPQEESADPDMAALFSHLASEGSTKIARSSKPPEKPAEASAATSDNPPSTAPVSPPRSLSTQPPEPPPSEAAAETAPVSPEFPVSPGFEATISVPRFDLSDEPPLADAPTEIAWPTAEFMPTEVFTPAVGFAAEAETMPGAEFMPTAQFMAFENEPQASSGIDPTLFMPQASEPLPAIAAIVPPANPPPVAARVAIPVAATVATQLAIPVTPGVTSSAPPVAMPVNDPAESPQTAKGSRSRKKPRFSSGVIIGGSSAAVLIVALGVYFLFFRGPSPDPTEKVASAKVAKSGKKKKSGSNKKTPSAESSVAALRGEFTVGPGGKYKTIAAALADLKKLKNNSSKKAVQIIKVAGGQTYAERIVIDESYPRGIQFVAESGAILAPTGTEPIVALRPKSTSEKIENFSMEGFELDAAGKEVAVELSGWAIGAQFKQLHIKGFSKAGVHFNGAQTFSNERERIVVENVSFLNPGSGAAGVLLSRNKTEDPGYIRINQCRFLGPLDCGIRLETNAIGIEISDSIFYEAVTGIKFQGDDRAWKDVLVASNTFYQNDRAIVFTNMPNAQTGDLGFHNNLFFNSKTADVVVEKDYKQPEFNLMYRTSPGGVAFNWTTRPITVPPKPDEIATLFDSALGKGGVTDIQFASTDPASPDFLAPAPTSPHRQQDTRLPKAKFGTQIGAVRPK